MNQLLLDMNICKNESKFFEEQFNNAKIEIEDLKNEYTAEKDQMLQDIINFENRIEDLNNEKEKLNNQILMLIKNCNQYKEDKKFDKLTINDMKQTISKHLNEIYELKKENELLLKKNNVLDNNNENLRSTLQSRARKNTHKYSSYKLTDKNKNLDNYLYFTQDREDKEDNFEFNNMKKNMNFDFNENFQNLKDIEDSKESFTIEKLQTEIGSLDSIYANNLFNTDFMSLEKNESNMKDFLKIEYNESNNDKFKTSRKNDKKKILTFDENILTTSNEDNLIRNLRRNDINSNISMQENNYINLKVPKTPNKSLSSKMVKSFYNHISDIIKKEVKDTNTKSNGDNDKITYKRTIKINNCFSIANKNQISNQLSNHIINNNNESEVKDDNKDFNLNLITNSGILKNKYISNIDENTIISPSDLRLIESNAYLRIQKEFQFTLNSIYSDSSFFYRLVDYCKANSIFADYFVLLNKKKSYEKAVKNNVEFCLYGKYIISEVENIINSLGINIDDILKKNLSMKKKKNELDLNSTLRTKNFI